MESLSTDSPDLMNASTTYKTLIMIALIALTQSCARQQPIKGVNLLQDRNISFENQATRESLQQLKNLGANSVALVVFLRQSSVTSTQIMPDPHVSDKGLRDTIQWAKRLDLQVMLKPQILVKDGWAGSISPENWNEWFEQYTVHLASYAKLAEEESVDRLIIGTELKQAATRIHWGILIKQLRTIYNGHLSYAAHGLDGVSNFAYWHRLDSASITLYPSLGNNNTDSHQRIQTTLKQLEQLAQQLPVPLWVAEVGIASRQQARQRPWAWQNLSTNERLVDLNIQQEITNMWLDALSVKWLDGVLLWAWTNNPEAGGEHDNGFSLQNKPAENVIACHWMGQC